jgi:hypothetical protein
MRRELWRAVATTGAMNMIACLTHLNGGLPERASFSPPDGENILRAEDAHDQLTAQDGVSLVHDHVQLAFQTGGGL